MAAMRKLEPGTLFRKLASARAIMPFPAFVSYVTGKTMSEVREDPMVKYACGCMGNMFRDLMGSSVPDDMSKMFDPSSMFMSNSDLSATDDIEKLMNKATQKFKQPEGNPGLTKIIKITISAKPKKIIKLASSDDISEADKLHAKSLIDTYGIYKIAYLRSLCEDKSNFIIDDRDKLILTCHNRIF